MSKNSGPSRSVRTVRSLGYITALGAVLAVWNAYSLSRDAAIATGPPGKEQKEFFIQAADRPDAETFFKNLRPGQRLTMARNIGRYDDAPLAKLCGELLADFDPAARQALTASLTHVAQAHPEAVAAELKETGSFQTLGVSEALKSMGQTALPAVVHELSVTEARSNAVGYLVSVGSVAVPVVLPSLSDPNADVRHAAADVLGKLRAAEAVAPLTQLYSRADRGEREVYLTALASIADPSSEALMASVAVDPSAPTPERAEAALGLGRIASKSAVQVLWHAAVDQDADISSGAITALQLSRDRALETPGQPEALRLRVAAAFKDETSNRVIRQALSQPLLSVEAARAGKDRVELEPDLARMLSDPNHAANGEFAEAAIASLASTDRGRAALQKLQGDENLRGFIERPQILAPR